MISLVKSVDNFISKSLCDTFISIYQKNCFLEKHLVDFNDASVIYTQDMYDLYESKAITKKQWESFVDVKTKLLKQAQDLWDPLVMETHSSNINMVPTDSSIPLHTEMEVMDVYGPAEK